MKRMLFGAAAAFVAISSCLYVNEERTRRDESVGRQEIAQTTVEVAGGLAAIRALQPGTLSIWAKAPTLRARITRPDQGPGAWLLTVDNAMADAMLVAAADSGDPVAVETVVGDFPTQKRWIVNLPPGGTTLTVQSARGEPTETWRFAHLGDIQEAIDKVQDIYARMNADKTIEFVVSAGDLTQQGTYEELDRFENELKKLRVPFFPTLGNHELGTDDGEPFQRRFGRANFHFVHGGMHFTFLDSASATIAPLVYDWLDGWLAEARDAPHAVLMHIPPIDPIGVRNGSFADRNEGSKLLTRLADGAVDLTIYGHIHSYYAFSNAGIPAHISGGGGSIPERFDGIGRHYLTVDVDPVRGVVQTGLVRIDLD